MAAPSGRVARRLGGRRRADRVPRTGGGWIAAGVRLGPGAGRRRPLGAGGFDAWARVLVRPLALARARPLAHL